jgi:hypothetical protein
MMGISVTVGVGTTTGAFVILLAGIGTFVGVVVDGPVGTGTCTGLDVGGTRIGGCGVISCGGTLADGACVDDIGAFVELLESPCVVGSAVGAFDVIGGGGGGITSGLLGDSVGMITGINVGALVVLV